ncbi:MAG: hypothetical protein IJR99_15465 [Kiritimatiellae bacterium]|nr:hypothetical protein [Kiritimatiellia bacterium]
MAIEGHRLQSIAEPPNRELMGNGLGNNRNNIEDNLESGRLATASRIRTVARLRNDRQRVVFPLLPLSPSKR